MRIRKQRVAPTNDKVYKLLKKVYKERNVKKAYATGTSALYFYPVTQDEIEEEISLSSGSKA